MSLFTLTLSEASEKLRRSDALFGKLWDEYHALEQALSTTAVDHNQAELAAMTQRRDQLKGRLQLMAQAQKENSCCGGCGCGN